MSNLVGIHQDSDVFTLKNINRRTNMMVSVVAILFAAIPWILLFGVSTSVGAAVWVFCSFISIAMLLVAVFFARNAMIPVQLAINNDGLFVHTPIRVRKMGTIAKIYVIQREFFSPNFRAIGRVVFVMSGGRKHYIADSQSHESLDELIGWLVDRTGAKLIDATTRSLLK